MSDVQALHYSTHAIESLQSSAQAVRRAMPRLSRDFERVADLLARAVKFILPPAGELLELRSLSESHLDLMRLPFPLVALEYQMPPQGELLTGALAEVVSSRRIALCWNETFAPQALAMPDYKEPGLYVLSLFYLDETRDWAVAAVGAFIPRENELSTVAQAQSDSPSPAYDQVFQVLQESGAAGLKSSTFQARYAPVTPDIMNRMVEELGENAAMARMVLDVRDEIITAWQFCIVANCSNVRQTTLEPPAKLNAKRLKNARVPFYESRVLLLPEEPTSGRVGLADAGGSGRASPRMHLRRGHVRQLSPGRATFVRAAVVGTSQRGLVDKQYAVPPPARH